MHPRGPSQDARRVLLSPDPEGQELMGELFPLFNAEEVFVTGALSHEDTVLQMARSLRLYIVVKRAEGGVA